MSLYSTEYHVGTSSLAERRCIPHPRRPGGMAPCKAEAEHCLQSVPSSTAQRVEQVPDCGHAELDRAYFLLCMYSSYRTFLSPQIFSRSHPSPSRLSSLLPRPPPVSPCRVSPGQYHAFASDLSMRQEWACAVQVAPHGPGPHLQSTNCCAARLYSTLTLLYPPSKSSSDLLYSSPHPVFLC